MSKSSSARIATEWTPTATGRSANSTWCLPRESTATLRDTVLWAEDHASGQAGPSPVPPVSRSIEPTDTTPGVDASVRAWLIVASVVIAAILFLVVLQAA